MSSFSARGWQSSNQKVLIGSFAEAAAHGDMVVNATDGTGSLNALILAGEANLTDKVLIDVSNPLDFSDGFPPSLVVFFTDSLAEQIQRAFPSPRVVKTLNTVTARVMTHPHKNHENALKPYSPCGYTDCMFKK